MTEWAVQHLYAGSGGRENFMNQETYDQVALNRYYRRCLFVKEETEVWAVCFIMAAYSPWSFPTFVELEITETELVSA